MKGASSFVAFCVALTNAPKAIRGQPGVRVRVGGRGTMLAIGRNPSQGLTQVQGQKPSLSFDSDSDATKAAAKRGLLTMKVPMKEMKCRSQKGKGQEGGGMMKTTCNTMTPMPSTNRPTTKKRPTQRPSKTKKPTPAVTTEVPSSPPSASASPSTAPSVSLSPSSSICAGTKLFPTNGHRYLLSPRELTYGQSVAYAASLPPCCGGKLAHLLTIANETENDFAAQLLFQSGAESGYIGYNNFAGTYEWVTGEPTTYTNWFGGNPDFGACVLLNNNGIWEDLQCSAASPDWATLLEYDCD